MEGEVANEVGYLPILVPKFPGRFYYLFGKPIDTAGIFLTLREHSIPLPFLLQVSKAVWQFVAGLQE